MDGLLSYNIFSAIDKTTHLPFPKSTNHLFCTKCFLSCIHNYVYNIYIIYIHNVYIYIYIYILVVIQS